MVEDYNGQMVLKRKLRITNEEAALTEDQIAVHFASIDEYSAEIERDPNNANAYFGRAMDFMLVQDFSEAIKNFSEAIERDPSFTMAYFNRAVERYKQLMYTQSQQASKDTYDLSEMCIRDRYIENWTFFLDLKIIVVTVLNMFKGEKNAY